MENVAESDFYNNSESDPEYLPENEKIIPGNYLSRHFIIFIYLQVLQRCLTHFRCPGTNATVANITEFLESESEDQCGEDNKSTGSKRKRNQSAHKKVLRKQRLEAGESYENTSGVLVKKKEFKDVLCGCREKCNEKVGSERREKIFKHFYSLNWNLKTAFIMTHVAVATKQRQYTRNQNSRRMFSRTYKLPSFDDADDFIVCKTYFRQTLQISDGRIDAILKRKQQYGGPVTDRRGKHEPHNKTKPCDVQLVCDFIKEFPAYSSHYSRKDNVNKKYLAPDLTLNEMYRLYSERSTDKKVCLTTFRKIFKEQFNLSFYKPKSDTCQKCDALNIKIKSLEGQCEKNDALKALELHHRKAEVARQSKNNDVANAKADETRRVLIFDLQKTLPTPSLSTGVAYYKRQLWTYNLGVHDGVSQTGYMYVWSENQASRGAQEIGSCLLKHIQTYLPPEITHLVLYSDSCGGQNRNIKMSLFLSHILQNAQNLKVIDQKFFVPGHSFSNCDQDFAIIEKAKRFFPDVFVPSHWADVIRKSKKRNPKFVVNQMKTDDFFSTEILEKDIVNRKKTTEGEKFQWLQTCWIRIEKENPRILKIKTTFCDDAPFKIVDLSKRKKGNRSNFQTLNLPVLYPKGRKLSKEKIKDLRLLCQYIPPIHHDFYNNLQEDETAEDVTPYSDEELEN